MERDVNDTDLGDAELRSLGRIAYWAAAIETIMRDIVMGLAQRDPTANEQLIRVFTQGASWAELQRHANALMRHVEIDADDASYIREQIAAADQMMSVRNQFLHGRWLSMEDSSAVLSERRSGIKVHRFGTEESFDVAESFALTVETFAGAHIVAASIMDAKSVRGLTFHVSSERVLSAATDSASEAS